jgi:GTP-binding protein
MHGRAAGDLLDRIVELLPDAPREDESGAEQPRFALVGRPNVGKSSLFNRLVGQERSVVFEEAGTTRDAVDAVVEWNGDAVRFVDTAGFRRPSRTTGVDYYSFLRAERAIQRADVAIVVLDATDGFTTEDRRIAAKVVEEGRGLIVVANKWDLVEERDRAYRALVKETAPFARAPVHRTSALRGSGVDRLPAMLPRLHERWRSRVPTSEVNVVIDRIQAERPPPGTARYRYATQVSSGPPVFVMFGGGPPGRSYERFMENRLRATFALDGVPIRLRFRARRDRRR